MRISGLRVSLLFVPGEIELDLRLATCGSKRSTIIPTIQGSGFRVGEFCG
jgi:hypothetical protein